MKPTFVDTSAIVALVDKSDRHHAAAKKALEQLGEGHVPLVTSTDVVDEVITLTRRRLGHNIAVSTGEALLRSRWCRLLDVDSATREVAWSIFVRYSDQVLSFTDCTSFALMRTLGVSDAFTFDRTDFSAAGFVVLPAP